MSAVTVVVAAADEPLVVAKQMPLSLAAAAVALQAVGRYVVSRRQRAIGRTRARLQRFRRDAYARWNDGMVCGQMNCWWADEADVCDAPEGS